MGVDNFLVSVENSDGFVNLASISVKKWTSLASGRCHGLLGQTWKAPKSAGRDVAPVEGHIDDYTENDNDLLGDQFVSLAYRDL